MSLARLQGVDRSLPIWIASALALVLLMALPLGWLAALSVGSESGPTLAHYRRVFADPALQKALWNTVVLAFWVGLASLAVGAPLAWLTARTDVPGRGLIRGLVLASFVTPPFLGAFAWVMLAGPNAGFVNKLWRSLTGAAGALFNIFSMPGLVFVVTIYTFPYVYIMIANTLALIASDLEEAAAILGAGRLAVARTVTLPMVAPALVSGFILSVLQALALFGSPAILAMPAGFHTITTQIWSFFHFPPKTEMAAAFSMPLLLATALLLLAQKKLLGRRGYAAVGGKGGQLRRSRDHGLRHLPALRNSGKGGSIPRLGPATHLGQPHPGELHLHLFRVQRDPGGDREHARARRDDRLRGRGARRPPVLHHEPEAHRRQQLVAFLALAPVVIPSVVLAVGLFSAYTRPPLILYGTLWILFIAYITKEMPVGYAQSDATFRAIPADLEDAGRILGGGRLRVLRDITAPLAKSGIIAAWCFIFIGVIRELSASIILFTPSTKVMSVVIFDLKEGGSSAPSRCSAS